MSLRLNPVRGFDDQLISFDFPVTALIGPNGGGKTTILGAAALAYKSVEPKQFFAKSGRFDDSMQDWKIEYDLLDRQVNSRSQFRRTSSFRQQKWNRGSVIRDVAVFGVARTVPANERVELRKCASSMFAVAQGQVSDISDSVAQAVQRILGKDVSGYSHIQVDSRGRVSLLTGKTSGGTQYSEFHFGAGESSIIRMVMRIELMPDNSLILIEEIENGLHPVATKRMVEYLIDIALRKSAQAIFTTHSNEALQPLPHRAIWASVDNRSFQGKLDVHSLRAIRGEIGEQLSIFVEDNFAKAWVTQLLRSTPNIAIDAVGVHAMEGDGTATKVHKSHNQDPTVTSQSVCFIDGDSRQTDDINELVYRLPGDVPEAYVFGKVLEEIDAWVGKLAVALQVPYESQTQVKTVVESVSHTNRDPHLFFSQVGENLGLLSEEVVRGAFLSIWAQICPDEVASILNPILERLPRTIADR